MHLPRLFTIGLLALLAGCQSLDNPFAGFRPFKTGHDARTFNVQTGEYDWPRDAAPRPRTRGARKTAAPAAAGDGREYDLQRREFAEPDPRR